MSSTRWKTPRPAVPRTSLLLCLALCSWPAASGQQPEAPEAFEPFAGIADRVEAESAKVLKQTFNDGTPGPMSAAVASAKDLGPWRGMGVPAPPEPDEGDLEWQRAASGGKVLLLTHSHRGEWYEPAKRPSPCARLAFRVPEDGRYFLFLRADSWCCGCQMLAFRIDDGPDQVLGKGLGRGWWGEGWRWRSLRVKASGLKGFEKLAVPEPFELRAGGHHLGLVCGTPLCAAVAFDQLVVAREMRLDVGQVERKRRALLHRAAECGNEQAVRLFLAHGADVNAKNADNERGRSPLQVAERHGHKAIARILLDRGAASEIPFFSHVWAGNLAEVERRLRAKPDLLRITDKQGWAALHRAAKHDCAEVAAFLIARSATVDAREADGRTPLHVAARHGSMRVVELLVARGAAINAPGRRLHRTPLHDAASGGHRAVAALLLRHGARVDSPDNGRDTPLAIAAWCGHRSVADLLIDRGADVNAAGSRGTTPLHRAARCGYYGVAELLLERGADVDAADERGSTPLHDAPPAIAALLMAFGADTEARGRLGYTPLLSSLSWGNRRTAPVLVAHGCNVNAKSESGETPLESASFSGHARLVKLLLDHGAGKTMADGKDGTALHHAAVSGDLATVRHLLAAGADANARDRRGRTPLYWAIYWSRQRAARLLVASGARLDVPNPRNWTPLHIALWAGSDDKARDLIAKGADVNARGKFGATPLHLAARWASADVCRLLVERGADVSARDHGGRKPLYDARQETRRVLER